MHSIEQTLAIATEHHRAGRVAEAERLYRDVLEQAPGQADAMHLLGVLALQSGRPEDAADLIAQAIAADDGEAVFHANLGHALHALARPRDAAESFARALVRLCNGGESWANIGALCRLVRRYDHDARRAAGRVVDEGYALGDVMRRRSLLFHLTGDLDHYEALVAAALAEPDRFTVPSLHYGYWGMALQLFNGEALSGDAAAFHAGSFRRLHRLLVEQTGRVYGIPARLRPATPRNDVRRIAIVTNQMLGVEHKPTMAAFTLARRLQDELGREVVIVNANAMAITQENGFVPEYAYNVADGYRGVQSVSAEGGQVRMASFPEPHFDAPKVRAIVDFIESSDPDAIIAFGGSNLIADLFVATRAVVCLPTGPGVVPSLADLILGFAATDTADGWPEDMRHRFRPFAVDDAEAPARLLDACREALRLRA